MQVVRELTERDGGKGNKFSVRKVDASGRLQFPQLLRCLKGLIENRTNVPYNRP